VSSLDVDGSARDLDALYWHIVAARSDGQETEGGRWVSELLIEHRRRERSEYGQRATANATSLDGCGCFDVCMLFPRALHALERQPVCTTPRESITTKNHYQTLSICSIVLVFIPNHNLMVFCIYFLSILLFWSSCIAALHMSTTCHLKAYLYAAPATTSFCTN